MVRRFLRAVARGLKIVTALIAVALLIWLAPAIFRCYWVFPRAERALTALRSDRIPPALEDGYADVRAALHVHSYWSHDSEGTLEDLVAGAKLADVEVIFLSDHPRTKIETFPRGIPRGTHDGVAIFPGSERDGIIVWPRDSLAVNWDASPAELISGVVRNDGMIFYCHPEAKHPWRNGHFTGMEIYNIHTDSKRTSLAHLLPDILLNLRTFPVWTYRLFYHEPTEFLERWDALSTDLRIVAIAGNDAHRNVGFEIVAAPERALVVKGTSGDTLRLWRPGVFGKALLSIFDMTPGKTLWRVDLDPYERSFRFVSTHLLVKSRSEREYFAAVRRGRAYVAFDGLADPTGFTFAALRDGNVVGVMGDTVAAPVTLVAESPLPVALTLRMDGRCVAGCGDAPERSVRRLDAEAIEPGVYRVEAVLTATGERLPWVYTNAIYVVGAAERLSDAGGGP